MKIIMYYHKNIDIKTLLYIVTPFTSIETHHLNPSLKNEKVLLMYTENVLYIYNKKKFYYEFY